MSNPRVFSDAVASSGKPLVLSREASEHLGRVLRLGEGAAVQVFDADGREYDCTISGRDGKCLVVTVGDELTVNTESPLTTRLIQGISRGQRMDNVVQKATELGVTAIQPVFTRRGVVKLDAKRADKRQEHWQGVAIGACEQSGRTRPPTVSAPCSLNDVLASPSNADCRLILHPSGTLSISDAARGRTHVELLIGPEGGFDDEEVAAAEAAGFVVVGLGARILRTETAPVVALALLQAQAGDLEPDQAARSS